MIVEFHLAALVLWPHVKVHDKKKKDVTYENKMEYHCQSD